MAHAPDVQVRRIHGPPQDGDRQRVLVDRLWPRGLSKERAVLDEWCQAIAPSAGLRGWYGHDPRRYEEFARRYLAELDDPERATAVAHLHELAAHRLGPGSLAQFASCPPCADGLRDDLDADFDACRYRHGIGPHGARRDGIDVPRWPADAGGRRQLPVRGVLRSRVHPRLARLRPWNPA